MLPQTNISEFFEMISGDLVRVSDFIEEHLSGSDSSVGRLLGSFNFCSGKMIRPGLLLLSGACFDNIRDEHIRVAAVFELMHNATLLHDDVIDEGRMRRGLATVNSLYGNESAVLLGDFILAKVLGLCSDLEPEVTGIIAETAIKTCNGEISQTFQKCNWQLSEAEYIDIITGKSAALFTSCCYLGGYLAKADKRICDLLGTYGTNVGIAFQITDDLLDIVGDESRMGKAGGSDIEKGKLTLALIHFLSAADVSARDKVIEALRCPEEGKEVLAEMLVSCGSLEYALSRAREYVEKAVSSLGGLGDSCAKQALIDTAKFVSARVSV